MRNIDSDALSEMTPQAIAELPPSVLADLQKELAQEADQLKAKKQTFESGLEHKYYDAAKSQLLNAGSDTGTTHITDQGVDVTVTIPKKVDWDQAALVKVFNGLSAQEAKHYARASYKVDERNYEAAPPAIKASLDQARTLKTGKPSFKFVGVVQ